MIDVRITNWDCLTRLAHLKWTASRLFTIPMALSIVAQTPVSTSLSWTLRTPTRLSTGIEAYLQPIISISGVAGATIVTFMFLAIATGKSLPAHSTDTETVSPFLHTISGDGRTGLIGQQMPSLAQIVNKWRQSFTIVTETEFQLLLIISSVGVTGVIIQLPMRLRATRQMQKLKRSIGINLSEAKCRLLGIPGSR